MDTTILFIPQKYVRMCQRPNNTRTTNSTKNRQYYNKNCIYVYHIFNLNKKIFQGIALSCGLCYLGTNALTQTGIQSVQGAIFIMVAENAFTPMYTVLNLFPQERPLFLREYKSGLYPIWIYYIAKCFAIVSIKK